MTTPAPIALLLRAVDALCTLGAWVGALSAAALALMLIVEVIATSFLNWSQPWGTEYSIYLQALILFGGSGWALRQGAHIRVAVLLHAMPPATARLLDLLGNAFAIGIIGYATWAMWQQWLRTFELGSTSYFPMNTPIWVPQGLLTLGVTLLLLAFVARIVRMLFGETLELGGGELGGGGLE